MRPFIVMLMLLAQAVHAQEPPVHKLKIAWKRSTTERTIELDPIRPGVAEAERWTKSILEAKTPLLFGPTPLVRGGVVYYRDLESLDARLIDGRAEVRKGNKIVEEAYKPGDYLWRSTSLDGSLGDLLDDVQIKTTTQAHIAARGALLLENALCGSLSADDACVYAIDDACLLQTPQVPRPGVPFMNLGAFPEKVKPLWSENTLYAFHLQDGRARWSLGGGNIRASKETGSAAAERYKGHVFNECHFLGAPLLHRDLLWVLLETKAGECELVRIDPKKIDDCRPDVQARLPLGAIPAEWRVGRSPCRRLAGAQPLAVGERLLCPTYAGKVIAWDVKKNEIAWTFTYREPVKNEPGPAMKWKPSVPLVSGTSLVFAPTDDEHLYCVSITDGTIKWKRPRRESDWYLAAVKETHACVAFTDGIRFVRLEDGAEIAALKLGGVSGRAVRAQDRLYVPLEARRGTNAPSIAVVHLEKKDIEYLEVDEVPGNLAWSDGRLFSQPPLSIVAYEKRK